MYLKELNKYGKHMTVIRLYNKYELSYAGVHSKSKKNL